MARIPSLAVPAQILVGPGILLGLATYPGPGPHWHAKLPVPLSANDVTVTVPVTADRRRPFAQSRLRPLGLRPGRVSAAAAGATGTGKLKLNVRLLARVLPVFKFLGKQF